MSNEYTLKFDLSSYGALDNFALLADQSYNLGDKGDWFTHFRWGLHGFYARVLGVRICYHDIHSWELVESIILSGIPHHILNPHLSQLSEYLLSTILFNMDSAIECLVFTLNALGYAANSSLFKDVTNSKMLAQIAPWNILGRKVGKKLEFVEGYDKYFPSVKNYWLQNRNLINKISEQHDVSKHRSIILEGGMKRSDPPSGLFARLGIKDNPENGVLFAPFREITLTPQPKTPWRQRDPVDYKDIDKLEDVAEKFCVFINNCGIKALDDAQGNIKLKNYKPIK